MTANNLMSNTNGGCVFELKCPNSYNAFPRITEIVQMPGHVRATLNVLWDRAIHRGQTVKIFERKNVFVLEEGLVFDQNRVLMPESKTYHNDEEIKRSIKAVELIKDDNFRIIDKAILTKSRGASNYGHSILEMLPRAWLARTSLNLTDWPALIHESSPELTSIMREALALAGFDASNVITSGSGPIFVKHLLVVDGLTSHTQYLSPFVMNFLDEITENVSAGSVKKLYVNRGANASRDFIDEPAISQELIRLGYGAQFTGGMSFREQVSLFRGAQSVVGVLGAALSNIAFCRPGAKVNCFMPSEACEVLFWMLAERRNLRYHEIRCAEEGPQMGPLPWDRRIRIPLKDLSNLVE